MESKILSLLLMVLCFTLLSSQSHVSVAQVPIPAKFDGFVYNGILPKKDSIAVEAFFDPLCPDSRDSWPPLKEIIKHYSPRITLTFHVFPLPYHDNSFVACRALTIADKINSSSAYPLLEQFFKYQEIYYGGATSNFTRRSITKHIAVFTSRVVGMNSLSKIESGFADSATHMATRTSFKYGCSRGVTGTPFFFVNGFPLPGGGNPLSFDQWKNITDPLITEK